MFLYMFCVFFIDMFVLFEVLFLPCANKDMMMMMMTERLKWFAHFIEELEETPLLTPILGLGYSLSLQQDIIDV